MGQIFRTCPDRPWGPPSFLYNGYRVFPGDKERPWRDADPSLPSSAVVKKGYSYTSTPPCGLYGLCRASVPVQGCNLPLPFTTSCLSLSPTYLPSCCQIILQNQRVVCFEFFPDLVFMRALLTHHSVQRYQIHLNAVFN